MNAQWADREAGAKMIKTASSQVAMSPPESTAASSRTLMRGGSTKNSLVGSWMETVTFPPPESRVLMSLTTFHDDGTMAANDQGSVTVDFDESTGAVTTTGVGVWAPLGRRKFAYTQHNLFSDLDGNLVGRLKVRGIYTLSRSGDEYSGTSHVDVFDTAGNLLASGTVRNEGERIELELPDRE
jgi:hypothetical protein